jgi:molybdopterin/thiamine biosynthesis adenylyltransferase
MNRLALLQIDVTEITDVLTASAPAEDGCFLLLREGRGVEGRRLLAVDPIFAPADGWEAQSPNQLRPSARWISATISRAIEQKAGLLFIHSHPNPAHPVGFSEVDRSAIASLAETIGPILDGPFAAAVVHPHGWIAAVAEGGELRMVDRIVSVGRTLRFLNPVESTPARRATDVPGLDDRQRDALGIVHDLIRGLHVGVVGAGGLGSPIAEQLVRMGTGQVTIVDHDALDTSSNVRRVFGSTMSDLRASDPPAKVDVVGRHLDQLGLTQPVIRVAADIRQESSFRRLLDTDVVISGTDTHGSRAIINDFASTYMLPVIDVGVQAGAKKNGDLAALVAEIRVLTPTTPCLWCRKSISSDVIRAENLPPEQRKRLVKEGYIVGGVGDPAPSVIALTVLGAGLATCALLALLSGEGDVCPSGYIIDGLMGDGLETRPTEPDPNCRCRTQLGRGDTEPPSFVAETAEPSAHP